MRISAIRLGILIVVIWALFTLFLFWKMQTRVVDVEKKVGERDEPRSEDLDAVLTELARLRHSLDKLRIDSDSFHRSELTHDSTIPSSLSLDDGDVDLPTTYFVRPPPVPVVVFTYKRAGYLRRCLNKIFEVMPTGDLRIPEFPVYVSQDGNDPSVADVVKEFGERIAGHFQRDRSKTVFDHPLEGPEVYYHISHNYGNGLRLTFEDNPEYERVIILEEDIEVGADFFEYMASLAPVLDRDETLLCVSAFNDNGLREHVQNPMSVFRSDFFPGLGWMMTKKMWDELGAKWPLGFWDDWLRLPENRLGRACLRPEISRTFTFGEKGGASKGQFSKFLREIELDSIPINWAKVDVTRYEKPHYDKWLDGVIAKATPINLNQKDTYAYQRKDLKMSYSSKGEFVRFARAFHVMDDEKANVPRGAYKGIISFGYKLNNVYLVPTRPDLLYSNRR